MLRMCWVVELEPLWLASILPNPEEDLMAVESEPLERLRMP